MQNNEIILTIKRNFASIMLGGIFLAAISFGFLVLTEKNFKVNTDFLIVQNQTGSQDAYTLSKSAEYMGKVLSESVYSELFINEALKTGKFDANILPANKKDKIKEWGKVINVNRNSELGVVSVQVFNNNQKQALAVSDAIAQVLTEKNSLFRGDSQNIEVKILSGPVWERNPSVANIALVTLGGFLVGLLLGFMKAYYHEMRKVKAVRYPTFSSQLQQGNDEEYLERLRQEAK